MNNSYNKYIVLIFIIIIVGVFVFNYDVYVVPKNEPLCKPIYVTKRPMSDNLNTSEMEAIKETFENIDSTCDSVELPPKSLNSFIIPSVTNPHKVKVLQSVLKVLTFIPTTFCEDDIKQMVEYFGIIYQSSNDLGNFYKNVSASTKINEYPYDSQYARLILFLIGKFDSDYSGGYIGNGGKAENIDVQVPSTGKNTGTGTSTKPNILTEYLNEETPIVPNGKNNLPTIDFSNEFNLSPVERSNEENILTPTPIPIMEQNQGQRPNVQMKQRVCKGARCSYKCSTNTNTTQQNPNINSVEGFNNLDYYAMF